MAEQMVTGIFPSSDIAALEAALGTGTIDRSRLSVITKQARTQASDDSFIRFVHLTEHLGVDTAAGDTKFGAGMMTDSGGTSVPGVSGGNRSLSSFSHRAPATQFAGLPIPPDQIDNYNDALEAGRTIVLYSSTPEEAPGAVEALRQAGLRNVKTFVPKAPPVSP